MSFEWAGLLTLVLILGLAAGCADYRFTVNDRVIYTPAPLFTDYAVADAALADCLAQHISDGEITAAAQLTDLNCSHAGISDLSGIEVFAGLLRLKLSNNRIGDLSALEGLTALRELQLDGNRLRGLGPLAGLPTLAGLDVSGNPELPCDALDPLRSRAGLELNAPARCD